LDIEQSRIEVVAFAEVLGRVFSYLRWTVAELGVALALDRGA
jgi:hypothetical protein